MPSLFRSILDSVWSWYSSKYHQAPEPSTDVQARYESAYQWWGQRGYIPATIQDARFDADSSTRSELLRRSRYWEKNSSILQRLIDLFEEYTVGTNGLSIVPSSDDEDWNLRASDWWTSWCHEPALDSRHPMFMLQGLMARSWFVDGEIFLHKTFGDDSKPRIQLIEAHRVATPAKLRTEEGKTVIDGVAINPDSGAVLGYWVRVANFTMSASYQGAVLPGMGTPAQTNEAYSFVDVQDMLHLFEPTRAGMYRGLPMAYAVLNDLQDTHELQHLEMRAARDAASITNVVTNKTGEANNQQYAKRNKWMVQSQDNNGNAVQKQIPVFSEVTMGGQTVYQIVGEKFEQFRSERPSVTTRDYWDYLTNKVCIGIGIPKMLVVPYSIQGTAVRADLETAAAYFKARSMVIGFTMREVYAWALGWGMKFDRTLKGAPKSWAEITVRPPRSVNVDVGRNSQAIIAELEAGIRPLADVIAELGGDWREVLRQRAKEAAYVNALVKEFSPNGVTRDQIISPTKALPAPAPQPAKPNTANGHAVVRTDTNGHTNRLQLVE